MVSQSVTLAHDVSKCSKLIKFGLCNATNEMGQRTADLRQPKLPMRPKILGSFLYTCRVYEKKCMEVAFLHLFALFFLLFAYDN